MIVVSSGQIVLTPGSAHSMFVPLCLRTTILLVMPWAAGRSAVKLRLMHVPPARDRFTGPPKKVRGEETEAMVPQFSLRPAVCFGRRLSSGRRRVELRERALPVEWQARVDNDHHQDRLKGETSTSAPCGRKTLLDSRLSHRRSYVQSIGSRIF